MIPVIIRSNLAGVHYGYMTKRLHGGGVRLEKARRIWEWQGAKTLSHAADAGFGTGTKIGPVGRIDVWDIQEINYVSDHAARVIDGLATW